MEDSIRNLSIKYVLAIAIGLPILYYVFYFKPPNELAVISNFEQQLIALDGEIKSLDRAIAEGDQVKANLELIKKEIKALSTYFIVPPNAKNIEQIISEEARATGISFTSLRAIDNQPDYVAPLPAGTVPQPSADAYIKRSIIEANFSGTFIELMRFLSYLSRTDRIISLKEIQLKSGQDLNQIVKRRANVKLNFSADFETYEIIKDVNADALAPAPPPAEGAAVAQ